MMIQHDHAPGTVKADCDGCNTTHVPGTGQSHAFTWEFDPPIGWTSEDLGAVVTYYGVPVVQALREGSLLSLVFDDDGLGLVTRAVAGGTYQRP